MKSTDDPAALPQVPMDIEELADFMAAFNESTTRLQESHDLLRKRVDELAGELSDKNRELTDRIAEVSALKNYLANILGSITDGVITLGTDRRLAALNAAAFRLLHPDTPENFLTDPLSDSAAGVALSDALKSHYSPIATLMAAALDDEKASTNAELWIDEPDGFRRCLLVSAAPIRDSSGTAAGAVATFRDNTELQRLEESLRRRERLAALGQMSAQLAHEIRNPLGGIELYSSLLERALAASPKEQDLARKIGVATASLNQLVEDMLTFTRPSTPRRASTRVSTVLEAALEILSLQLSAASVSIERDYCDDDVTALDPDLMQRAFMNVVLNSCQIMQEKGGGGRLNLAITRRKEDNAVQITVADSGPGVAEANREQIFNPFFSRREGGTGLGLAIVQKILQEHGGNIFVKENTPHGAAFIFTLQGETEREDTNRV